MKKKGTGQLSLLFMMQMNLFKKLHWKILKRKKGMLGSQMKSKEFAVKKLITHLTDMIKRPQ